MFKWCGNWVEFRGEPAQIKQLECLLYGMAMRERKEKKGQLPPFISRQSGHLFDIGWEDGILCYETIGVPNIEVMAEVAAYYNFDFVLLYMEPSQMIFGEATCKNGWLEDIYLDKDDFDHYYYNEASRTFAFENETYESNLDILEILLGRKKAIYKL